ncbi:hypothetical protein C5S32_03980 [ANME-1 cluster archaeon GoMg1]|nr:hypothetical protein [ANME-1 cluster archaeon GoMg1]
MQKIYPGCRLRVVLGRGLFASSVIFFQKVSGYGKAFVCDSITRKLDCAINYLLASGTVASDLEHKAA